MNRDADAPDGEGDKRPTRRRVSIRSAQQLRLLLDRSGLDPDGRRARLLKKLALLGRDDLVQKFSPPLEWKAARRLLERRPFPVVRTPSTGPIRIGTSTDGLEDGAEIGLSLEPFRYPSGVFGQTGGGKSWLVRLIVRQLIAAGVSVWLFDLEDEFRALLPLFRREVLWWVRPSSMTLNPFAAVGDPKAWIAKIVALLRSIFYMRDGAATLLSTILGELYDRRGCPASGRWPSPGDVFHAIQATRYGASSRNSGHRETLERAIRSLLDGLGSTVNVETSMPIEPFLARSVIFDLSDLDVQQAELFICLLLLVSTETEGA